MTLAHSAPGRHRLKVIVLQVQLAGHQPEAEGEAWPVVGVAAGGGLVPGIATGLPDTVAELVLKPGDIVPLALGLDVDVVQARVLQQADTLHDIADL